MWKEIYNYKRIRSDKYLTKLYVASILIIYIRYSTLIVERGFAIIARF